MVLSINEIDKIKKALKEAQKMRKAEIIKNEKMGTLHKIIVLLDKNHKYLITNEGGKWYGLFSVNDFGELWAKNAYAKNPDELIKLLQTVEDLTKNFTYLGMLKR
jgi:hypothetical protein